ncbi:MAG: TetR/AcrR family transcriptional regulator [Proteobacteria bacterium]|nr:TetR/AcrR family transcriptional regulator [Pseudomonadota bacterium]
MKTTRFEQISISDICSEVGISEATFYNYFPQKIDVIFYFSAVHILKSRWIIFHEKKDLGPIRKMEMVFEQFSKKMKHPFLFFEVVSVLSSQKILQHPLKIEDFEKKLLYPDCEGIERVSLKPIKEILKSLIIEAKDMKLINDLVKVDDLALLFYSTLIGAPLSLDIASFDKLLKLYKLHLSIIWSQLLSPKGKGLNSDVQRKS